ncbi:MULTISPECIES: cellulose synthase family protein [Anaeromyxobacter]|uniref:cellulose synthase family protein n=1 Tax=Anaeromyxobacter TaxID=161492 RepID=UPI001F567173|nr:MULTISPECIES: cellulose synthase family protein [unclassified Anaeromyxobacter]
MSAIELSVVVAYALLLLLLSVYGSHRYAMAYLYYRHKYRLPSPKGRFEQLPRVTIQLPIFNEMYVTERLIDAVAKMDYPRDLLEIQVLDDSTDETQGIARACVDRHRKTGLDIAYVHRTNRKGFKAGALEHGLTLAKGEFVAVFDADFIPESDFLRRTLDFFTDPQVGMVQTRWGHLNRSYSLLTEAQAILLDGHFVIEHTARNRSGLFFNFNGTAGIWRRDAIASGGGWQHDTLTEDLDLSYRTQMKGWKFVYLPHVVTSAEVPVEMNAFKSQQHRWAKGSIQTALKLLPLIRRADVPRAVKREAFMHLTANLGYLMMIPLAILLPITVVVRVSHGALEVLFLDLPFFAAATFSVVFFYMASQREQGKTRWERVKYLPFVMALGIGLAVNQARAVVEALMGYETAFTRTPKHGVKSAGDSVVKKRYKAAVTFQPIVELALAAYMTYGVLYLVERGVYYSLPFLVLFQVGFGYVGLASLYEGVRGYLARSARQMAPQPSAE